MTRFGSPRHSRRDPRSGNVGRLLAVLVAAAMLAVSASLAYAAAGTARASSVVVPPANIAKPSVTGTAEVGGVLSATNGTWSGTEPLSFAYTWLSCDGGGNGCAAIAGAATATYSPQAGDLGHALRIEVTATNGGGSASATSAGTAAVASPQAPYNVSAPVIYASSKTLKAGDLVVASVGTWLGAAPIHYTYQWTRCDSKGAACSPIPGAKQMTYTIAAADVGRQLFVQVKASNSQGATFVNSAKTPNGIQSRLTLAAPPEIKGSPVVGATLTVTPGAWVSPRPIQFTYQWTRCQGNGSSCTPIFGAKSSSYTAVPADIGNGLFVQVKAISGTESVFANSARVVTRDARTITAGAVFLPNRLVISGVQFTPSALSSREPFQARFRITDASGRAVRGALVYALGIPYSWVANAPEVATGADGWATMQITPTAKLPLTRGTALVMFVRARRLGDRPLAGVSSRRLVQIVVGSRSLAVGNAATFGSIVTAPTPIDKVSLPNRLVISDVKFQPSRLGSRQPFNARFRITDTSGSPVQGALVYALGLPYGWAWSAPEVLTGADGWATVQITPTAQLPLARGTALVIFVRARKTGENVLAGVSNRRLVQVVVG